MNTSHAFVPLNVHKHRFPCWDNNIIWIVRSHSHEKKTNLAFHIVFQDFHTWYKPALASVTVGGGKYWFYFDTSSTKRSSHDLVQCVFISNK